ncbi:MAG: hypothetical protein IIX27_00690 [Ruminococcus sp.]|nr:hypothetical protein [Ruminococcus sp.]
MANLLRVKCSCGEVTNAEVGAVCSKCKQPLEFVQDALIMLYRKGSPLGCAAGFGVYLDGQPFGFIGNRETIKIPVSYGKHTLHIASGMNRKCNDLVFELTPENRFAFAKVWMKPGFWTNSFVLEVCDASEMPNA